MTHPSAMSLMPHLAFHLGQRVVERLGDDQETAKTCESEIVSVEGRLCISDTGFTYDRVTGREEPKGKVYRAIRSLTVDDRKRAENLLGGTESAKKP